MPEFKDISEFEVVQPLGTEKIQVSASNCVELITLVSVLGPKTSWYQTISTQLESLNTSVSTIQTNVVNLTSRVSTLESNVTDNKNQLSIIKTQLSTVNNYISVINSRYLLHPNYKCRIMKVEQLKVTGNMVLYLPNISWDIDTTIVIDVDNWGAGTGALDVTGFFGPNFSSSKIISDKPLKFTTNNHQRSVFGNLSEVESEISNIAIKDTNSIRNSTGIKIVYDIIPFQYKISTISPEAAYQFMIIGKIITDNSIQESYD